MQLIHLIPAAEALYARSLQVMSALRVFDELGSEVSSSGVSMHNEAHGEFGVTWRGDTPLERRRVRSASPRAAIVVESSEGEQDA